MRARTRVYCSVLVVEDDHRLLPLLTLTQKPHHCMELESLSCQIMDFVFACTIAGSARHYKNMLIKNKKSLLHLP